ncbi:MAG: (2Fe-2S) ferredoxin domain-containing protein [Spirochaetota bacterium]
MAERKPMTLEELRKMRREKESQLGRREASGSTAVVTVGMGTSGIASGAKEVMTALADELDAQGLSDVQLRQAGGFGAQSAEPTVEVRTERRAPVLFGYVTPEVAKRIVTEYIINDRLIENHVIDHPAADMFDADGGSGAHGTGPARADDAGDEKEA